MVILRQSNRAEDLIKRIYKISDENLDIELSKILDIEKTFLIEDADLKKQMEAVRLKFIEEHPEYPELAKYHSNNIVPRLRELEPIFEKQTFLVNDVLIRSKGAYERLSVAKPTKALKLVNKFRRSVHKLDDYIKEQVLPLIREFKKELIFFTETSASISTELKEYQKPIKEKKAGLIDDIVTILKNAWEKVEQFITDLTAKVLKNIKNLMDIGEEFEDITEEELNG